MEPHRKRPDWVRRINQLGVAAGDARLVVPLNPEELLTLARQQTGLDTVGDELWVETFLQRVRSIDEESGANLMGRLLCRAEALRVLQTRLRLHRHWEENPAILEEPIEKPLFIMGAPRTGTTILLELLALDPALRAPLAWEAHHPLSHEGAPDFPTRLALAESEQEFWADIQPELMTLHELRSDLPCECVHFMALDFGSAYWAMHYRTPSFDAWAAAQGDLAARTYQEHRKFLQTLQFGQQRRRWLLKSPAHMATVEQLHGEYPDAIFLQTHRHPVRFVGSTASTTAMIQWLRSDDVDRPTQGQVALVGFAFMLDHVRSLRSQGALPDEQFVDTRYTDLVTDPVAAIRSIYERAGLTWPTGHGESITSYLEQKPKDKFGKHEYSLAEYGLDEAMIHNAFAAYIEHYGIEPET